MKDIQTTELLTDIHKLLDLIECVDLVNAREWWLVTLAQIRSRYAGMDPRPLQIQKPTKDRAVNLPKRKP